MTENHFQAPTVNAVIKRKRRFAPQYWLTVIVMVIISFAILEIPGFHERWTWIALCAINGYFIARYWTPFERFYMYLYNVLMCAVYVGYYIHRLLRIAALLDVPATEIPFSLFILVTPLLGLAASSLVLGI